MKRSTVNSITVMTKWKVGFIGLAIVGILVAGCAVTPEEQARMNAENAVIFAKKRVPVEFEHQGMKYVGYLRFAGEGRYRLVDKSGNTIIVFDARDIEGHINVAEPGDIIGAYPVEMEPVLKKLRK